MASPGLSEIVTSTLRNRTGVLQDNFSRNNALITRLNKRGKVKTFSGGREIDQEIAYQNNQSFLWYSGFQTLNINPSTIMTSAYFPIRQAAIAVTISGLEQLQNAGKEKVIDLLESRIENAEDTFLNGLSQAMYGDGSVTGTINGLQALIANTPTSGVVGGIDRSVWQFWQNQSYSSLSNGGAAATSANITRYMNSLYKSLIRGRDAPDLIVADGNYWQLYLESLQAIQRIQSENGAPDLAEAGFQTLKYMNADVVLDGGFQGFSSDPIAVGGVPTNTMYMINTKYLHWRPHADRNMVPMDPADRFSVNQDAMVKLMGWAGNMTLSCAFLQGVLKA